MPSGARRISRGSRNSVPSHEFPNAALKFTLEPPNLPKHVAFPSSVSDSDVFFDLFLACFAVIGAFIQFLYLYRSVWWLPNSYTQSTMNFYLIQKELVFLIVIIFFRRVFFVTGCKISTKFIGDNEELSSVSRSILASFYIVIIGLVTTFVLADKGKMDIVYMFYPITLYIPIFGLRLRPFFEVQAWCSNSLSPIHACSSNPVDIRRECEHLKSNLLDRLRQIFFTAAINAYYGSFIPCCFSQSELVYDRWWNIEHGILIFLGSLIFSFTHMIPLRYCDILHRAVLHLGMWEKVDNERNLALVTHEWRDDCLWPAGALVKHNKVFWRSVGDCNAAVPGDKTFSWGYQLFILPSNVLGLAVTFQSLLVIYLIYSVVYSVYWYRIFSLSFLAFFNYYSLYKLLRDTLVSYKIYKQSEDNDEDKDDPTSSYQRAKSQPITAKNDEPVFAYERAGASDDDTVLDGR